MDVVESKCAASSVHFHGCERWREAESVYDRATIIPEPQLLRGGIMLCPARVKNYSSRTNERRARARARGRYRPRGAPRCSSVALYRRPPRRAIALRFIAARALRSRAVYIYRAQGISPRVNPSVPSLLSPFAIAFTYFVVRDTRKPVPVLATFFERKSF